MDKETVKSIDELVERRLEIMDTSIKDAFEILLEIYSERRFISCLMYFKEEKAEKTD